MNVTLTIFSFILALENLSNCIKIMVILDMRYVFGKLFTSFTNYCKYLHLEISRKKLGLYTFVMRD